MPVDEPPINFDMTVDEVMRLWPATIRVFLDFRTNCVGCPFARFHTVLDACREHRAVPEDFLSALRATAAPCARRGSVVRHALGETEQAVRVAHDNALPTAFDQALLLPRA